MTRWFLSARPGYVRVAPWSEDAFTPLAAFSTRAGGASRAPFDTLNLSAGVGDDPAHVLENRGRLLASLGVSSDAIAYATQVHGGACSRPLAPGLAGEADGLMSADPALAVVVGTADCLGVLLWSRDRPVVAAVHAGWRGIVTRVIPAAVVALGDRDTAPASRLRAALGPRIGACCFEVGPEVAEQFDAGDVETHGARTTVNLAHAARRQLAALGVPEESILDVGRCTACEPDSWFSHRRDRGRTGRLWAIASARPAAARGRFEAESSIPGALRPSA